MGSARVSRAQVGVSPTQTWGADVHEVGSRPRAQSARRAVEHSTPDACSTPFNAYYGYTKRTI
jgi:hypothetical protein